MSVVAATLRELMALGVTGEALVRAIERIEEAAAAERSTTVMEAVEAATRRADAALAEKRAKAAERTRKWREARDAAVTDDASPSVTVISPTVTLVCDAGAQVVTPFSSSLRSEEVGGGGGGVERGGEPADDWPAGKATDHAKLLVQTVASPRLDPDKSGGLVTTTGRLVAWRRDGASWEHDVVPVVTALCGKQRTPVSTWKFFDNAIARSISDNRAALEIPEARKAHERPDRHPAQTARSDRLGRSLAGLMAAVDEREPAMGGRDTRPG